MTDSTPDRVKQYWPLILDASKRYGVPPDLIAAHMHAESGGTPSVTGEDGEYGLMQLLPSTARGLGLKKDEDPYNPARNIDLGTRYLSENLRRFKGNEWAASVAYNQGGGATARMGGHPSNPGTAAYVKFVHERRTLYSGTPDSWGGALGKALSPRSAEAGTLAARADASGRDFGPQLFGPRAGPPAPQDVSPGRDFGPQLFGAAPPPQEPAVPAPLATTAPTELSAQAQDSGGTPQAGASPARQDAAYLGLMPGMEFMGVLPQGTQETVAQEMPGIAKGVAATGINVLGGAGGAALGGLTSPVTGPVGPVVGEMAGSYAARKLNVALGLEEPGILGDVASVAVPGAVRSYQALKPIVARRLPGAGAALHGDAAERLAAQAPAPSGTALPAVQTTLEGVQPTGVATATAQQSLTSLAPTPGQAGQQLDTLLTGWQPAVPSAQLYAPLHGDATPIRPSAIWKASRDVIKREEGLQPSFRNAQVARVAQDLQTLVKEGKGAIPLNTLVEHQQRLGLLIRQASAENWPQERALKQLYAAFYADVDHAAAQGVTGAVGFREAAATARREFALEDVRSLLKPGSPGVTTGPGGQVNVPPGVQLERALERKAAQDPLFRDSFTPDEWKALRAQVKGVQAEDALQGFAQHLQPGRPGMVTDPATGAVTIGDVKPIRQAFERELADNPAFRAQVTPSQVKQLRQQFAETEQEQALSGFMKRLQPGQPGVAVDPQTGATTLTTIRPVRMAFEKEVATNPAFEASFTPAGLKQVRSQFHAAEQEQAQQALSTMMQPGSPNILVRPDGLVQIQGGKLAVEFEKKLADPLFREALSPHQVKEIRALLAEIQTFPRIPPPAGQAYGSGQALKHAAIGAIAGGLTGSPTAAAFATAGVPAMMQAISRALMTESGRAWLLRTLQKTEGVISPALLGLASGGGRQVVEQGMTVEHQPAPTAPVAGQ